MSENFIYIYIYIYIYIDTYIHDITTLGFMRQSNFFECVKR
jgi:hypothetical protein